MSESVNKKVNSYRKKLETLKKFWEYYEEYKDRVEKIVNDFNELKEVIDDPKFGKDALQSSIKQVNNLIDSANQYLENELENIKQIALDNEEDIKKYHINAQSFNNEISKLKTEFYEILNNIKEAETDSKLRINQINEYFEEKFTPLQKEVEDPENGLIAIKQKVTNLSENIKQLNNSATNLHTQIKDSYIESQKKYSEIKKNYDKSNSDKIQIKNILNESDNIKVKLLDHLKFATNGTLSSAWFKRTLTLENKTSYWKNVFVLAVIGIVLTSLILTTLESYLRIQYEYSLRLFSSLPILSLIFIAYQEYKKERFLEEKYAFKTAISLTIESYTELLTATFKEKEYKDQLLDFVKKTMGKVFTEPYSENQSTFFSFGLKSSLANFEARIEEKLEENKEILVDKIEETAKKNE